jgi:hypothetical protein
MLQNENPQGHVVDPAGAGQQIRQDIPRPKGVQQCENDPEELHHIDFRSIGLCALRRRLWMVQAFQKPLHWLHADRRVFQHGPEEAGFGYATFLITGRF